MVNTPVFSGFYSHACVDNVDTVPLGSPDLGWSGFPFPDVQRVDWTARMLATRHPKAIASFLDMEEGQVKLHLRSLEIHDGDTMAALEADQLDERVNLTQNQDWLDERMESLLNNVTAEKGELA